MATVTTLRNRLSRLQKPAGPFDHLTDEQIEARVAELNSVIATRYAPEEVERALLTLGVEGRPAGAMMSGPRIPFGFDRAR